MAKQNVSYEEKLKAVMNYRKMMADVDRYDAAIDSAPQILAPTRFETLSRLFERRYVVPEYQRDYAWKPEIQTAYYLGSVEGSMLAGRPIYSLGDIIVHCETKKDEEGNRITTYYLVDGQQRGTTQILVLVVLRDILQATYNESELRKQNGSTLHKTVVMLNNIFKKKIRETNGVESEQYLLLSRTRPQFNAFLIDLYENTGVTFNLNSLTTKYKGCKDKNVLNALDNIKYIHDYFHSTFRGRNEDEKRKLMEYYECFVDSMMNCVLHGVVELKNAQIAKETYYTKNMTGMRMSDVEGFRFMIIAENTPENERVKYGELWNDWVDKYQSYGRGGSNGESMGLLSLVRSNLKAKYTEFAPRHSGANESTLYNAVKDTVVYGNENLGIGPNSVYLAHELEKYDKYLDMVQNVENSAFSDSYRQNYTYLRLASPSPKWLSMLILPFDLFGDEAYKIIDKYTQQMVNAVMFMMAGKDATNLSLTDDMFDTFICNLYRQHKSNPFKSVYDFVETFEILVKENYVQKDGSPVTVANFKAAWEDSCDKKAVRTAVALSYEYLSDRAGFYKNFRGKNYENLELLPLLAKSGENLEYGAYATMNNARWCCMLANASTFKRNRDYHSNKRLCIKDFRGIIRAEVTPFSPSSVKLWSKTIGEDNGKYTQAKVKAYSDALRNTIMTHLGITV